MCDGRGMRRLPLALLVLAACSDSSAPGVDAPPAIDAAVDAPSNPADCLISTAYGDLGTKTGITSQGPTTLSVVLDAGPPRDSFFIKLNAGVGVFSGGLANGTYTLTGAELDLSTCGLCVSIIADIVTGQGPTKLYFATGGTVTLTDTAPPTGTMQDVTFQEVDFGGGMVPGGCTSSITAMAFGT